MEETNRTDRTVVVVDAMGGDNAPGEIVKGAIDAVNKNEKVEIILCGKEELIKKELEQYKYPEDRVSVQNATEVITTEEAPVMAVRKKKDSSIVVGQSLIKAGKADAFISAGSTGAVLAAGIFVTGRIKGVERPVIGTIIPTAKGACILVDSGANADCRATQLVQFARMGAIYMEYVMGVKNPTVGLVNIGVEDEKGNALVKETLPLLKECEGLNFIGSVEAREIPNGGADVIVCDGFTGNVILKMYEGTAGVLLKEVKGCLMSSLKTKIGALLIKSALKNTLKKFDAHAYGGAPLLGLNGLVVKTHGNAKAKEVCTSVLQCVTFKEQGIKEKITEQLGKKKAESAETNE